MRILLADNRDSFTRNLEHLLFAVTGRAPDIAGYDAFTPQSVQGYDLLVISPGPGHPREYPAYGPVLESGTPVLGVCLGLQIMNLHFGGGVSRLPGCFHGRASTFTLFGREVAAARYHSLYLSRVAEGFEVLGKLEGVPMAARHESLPLLGLQFHPESFLTTDGAWIIRECLRRILPASGQPGGDAAGGQEGHEALAGGGA
jgi:para-aminobenzoate synthetase component 2